ncbi:hypothetical protein G3I20_11705, partial [Streptomyces sp. SID8111]|nr:hypothetical protein [Streptomyces sp. SID8111]
MSSTRRANKRARLARRAENDAMRTARRDSLAVLLARLARGIAPTPDEVALLRAAVEAEIREGDAARLAERGQQRAMEQQRQRVEAAEAAMQELEAERDEMRSAYDRACKTIAVMHEAATGRTGEGPVRGVVEDVADVRARMLAAEERAAQAEAELTRSENAREALRNRAEQAAADVAPGVAVIRDRAAEEHRRRLAAVLAKHADTPFPDLIEYTAQCLTGAGERITAADERAAQAAADV